MSKDAYILIGIAIGLVAGTVIGIMVTEACSAHDATVAAPYIDKLVAGESVNFIKFAHLLNDEARIEQVANEWCDRNGVKDELEKADKVQEIKALLAYQLVVANRADLPTEKSAE